MQGNADFIIIRRRTIVTYIVILIVLALATPALADYLGPDRTVTEWSSVCKVVLMECRYVPARDDYRYKKVDDWSCSLEGKPWQSYPDQPSSQGCFSATEGDQYVAQSEVLQETTTIHPPATITGALQNCTLQNGWCVTVPQLELAASEPLSGYNILAIEGTLNGQTFGCSDSNCTVGLIEGNNDFGFWALSSWGDSSTMGILSAKVDSISPTVGLDVSGSSGTNGWYTSSALISALGSDSGSGLAEASLSVDSGVWQTSTTLTEGIYNMDVRAIDNAGNISSSATIISVDTTTPSLNISINGTLGGNGWYKSTTQVSAAASDSTSGVGALEVSVNGGAYQVYTSAVSLSDGYHTVQFKATDNAGNFTESTVQGFYVDTLAPEVFIVESWELGEEVSYTVKDFGSDLAFLRVVIEDEDERFAKVAWNEDVSGEKYRGYINWNGKFKDGTVAPPGTYFAWIKSSDIAGNEYVALGRIIVPEPNPLFRIIQTESNSVSVEDPTPPSELFEEDPAPTTITTPSITPAAQTAVFGGSTAQAGVSTTQSLILGAGTPSSSTTSSNVLWGATAAAVLGAATAYAVEENRRRKAAEEAQRAAIVARIDEMEEQKEASYEARKVAQWLEGQELLKIEKARLHGASDEEIEISVLNKLGTTQGLGNAIDETTSLTSSLERTRADIDRKELEDEQNLLKKLAEKDPDDHAMQEQRAGLAAYYAAMRQGEHIPNWWEQTKSFVNKNIIQPVNTHVYQPIVIPAVEKTKETASTVVSWAREQIYQPYIKPKLDKRIEEVQTSLTVLNEYIYQPYIKPQIEREVARLESTISWVNDNVYQPYIKPEIEREIDSLVSTISWVKEHVYEPYIKPSIDREMERLTSTIAWINENIYEPHIQPLVEKASDVVSEGMAWIDTNIYQPVFQPVVSDIQKYIFDPLANKAENLWDEYGEWVHGALDAAGFIPGLGEVADGLNGLIYLGEGRYIEASVSVLAMIPILGDLGKAGKWTFKIGQEVLEEVAEKVIKETAEEVAEKFVKETAEQAAEIIAKESVEESAEKSIKEVSEEFIEKSTKEILEEVAEKTAKEISEEVIEKAPKLVVEKATRDVADNITTKVINVTEPQGISTKIITNPAVEETVREAVKQINEEVTQRALKEVVEGKVTKLPVDIVDGLTDESARELAEKISMELGGKKVWVSAKTGSLYVSSPPAEGLALAKQLAEIDLTNTAEVEKILRRIAELTSRGSGNHVVLGPFKPNGAFIQEALDTDGIFWDVGDDLWEALDATGIDMFLANDQFLKLQAARGIDRFDIIVRDIDEVFDNINSTAPKKWDEISYTEKEILDLETMPSFPYERVGNSWIRIDAIER